MTAGDVALSTDTLQRLRDVLTAHDVKLALLFGSAARPNEEPADIDIAIAFEDHRPTDTGYAAVYFDLLADLTDLECDVDVVDVHTMQPQFSSVVFDEGVLIVGSPDRRDALAEQLVQTEPTLEDARERIGAAATRLREQSS